MEITKYTVCETIENYLKELKVRYSIIYSSSKECTYELFISSISGYIQVEYNLDDENDSYFVLQFYTAVDDLFV